MRSGCRGRRDASVPTRSGAARCHPNASEDPRPIDDLIPEVYDALRALAGRLWADAPGNPSLHPTQLVHEVYLRFARDGSARWEGRSHVIAVAAKAMRQILTDRARARGALKRGGDRVQVTLTGLSESRDPVDLLAVDAALSELERLDPRRAQVFVLRALGGLKVTEVAEVLEVSPRTVKSDWRLARAWLLSRLEAR